MRARFFQEQPPKDLSQTLKQKPTLYLQTSDSFWPVGSFALLLDSSFDR